MMKPLKFTILAVSSLLCLQSSFAQTKTLTQQELLGGRLPTGFNGTIPNIMGWQSNKEVILSYRGTENKTVVMDVTNGKTSTYNAPQDKGGTPRAYVRNGDIYLQANGQEKRLTTTKSEEKTPDLSPDGTMVAFTRDNDLYTINIANNTETRLTTGGNHLILNGFASWVYWEEIFGRGTAFKAYWWSPNSKTIAYMQYDQSMINMFPLYNADGSHGRIEETRYPKAGDPNPAVKLGFIPATGGSTVWVDFDASVDHQLGWPKWRPNANELYVQWQNRDQDHLVMYAVNPTDGSKKKVYEEQQAAWISLDDADQRLTFINEGKDMLIQSDKSGWEQLYLYSADGSFKNKVTDGNFTVTSVAGIDEKNNTLYFLARGKENSARNDVYCVGLDGKKMQRLSFGEYNHGRISFSPDYSYFTTMYSNVNTPTTLAIVNQKGKVVQALGSIGTGIMTEYKLAKTELIRIKSADGKYELPALVTWPTNYDANKQYPMLVNVYGGPNATNVMDGWNWNPNKQWYADEGLLQVSFDNRASGHFGKAGIAEIHRQMGILEIEDFSTMAKYFIDKGIADPKRVCMTGFSFGGYMTCMALTYASDVFTHGMAGGSVTDWRLYDNHYTERYMDKPQDNEAGYNKTSAMTYAKQYKGKLQIVHGTLDDNVHMQNTLQLVGALQDVGKDFELMLYPNGRHGWGNLPGRSTHYNNLKTKFIYDNLLQKTPPVAILK